MTDGIEIQFDRDEGHLRLDCSDAKFLEIRDLVLAGASTADRFGPFIDGIRSIVIRRASTLEDARPQRIRNGFRVLVIALVLALALAFQIIGFIAVIRWLVGGGS